MTIDKQHISTRLSQCGYSMEQIRQYLKQTCKYCREQNRPLPDFWEVHFFDSFIHAATVENRFWTELDIEMAQHFQKAMGWVQ